MFGQEIEDAIQAHMVACFPNEGCGAVVRAENGVAFVPLPNVHPEPTEAFDCDAALNELRAEGQEILALVHSHAGERPEPGKPENAPVGPSQMDMEQQLAMGIPWGLAVTDGNNITPTLWWGPGVPIPPLLGRQFRHGPSGSDGKGDCYALIKDWYQVELGIELPEGPRDDKWWEDGKDLYMENFERAGFRRVDLQDAQRGDVLLAHVFSSRNNHGAVYTGNGLVMHHLGGHLSVEEPVARWQNLITVTLRYDPPS